MLKILEEELRKLANEKENAENFSVETRDAQAKAGVSLFCHASSKTELVCTLP